MSKAKLHVRLTDEEADLVVRLCREVSWANTSKTSAIVKAVEDARKPMMVNL